MRVMRHAIMAIHSGKSNESCDAQSHSNSQKNAINKPLKALQCCRWCHVFNVLIIPWSLFHPWKLIWSWHYIIFWIFMLLNVRLWRKIFLTRYSRFSLCCSMSPLDGGCNMSCWFCCCSYCCVILLCFCRSCGSAWICLALVCCGWYVETIRDDDHCNV